MWTTKAMVGCDHPTQWLPDRAPHILWRCTIKYWSAFLHCQICLIRFLLPYDFFPAWSVRWHWPRKYTVLISHPNVTSRTLHILAFHFHVNAIRWHHGIRGVTWVGVDYIKCETHSQEFEKQETAGRQHVNWSSETTQQHQHVQSTRKYSFLVGF